MSSPIVWMQLLRISAIPTVWTNVLMAYWVAHRGWQPCGPLLVCLLASTCVYWAGMVWNDIADVARDRVERPERPLPSGRIEVTAARRVGWGLLCGGGLAAVGAAVATHGPVALPSGGRVMTFALVLIVLVLCYDFFFKSTWFGPWNMGLCRSANLGFVLSTATDSSGFLGISGCGWCIALAIGLYIAGVTSVARHEATFRSGGNLARGVAWMLAGLTTYGVAIGWLAASSGPGTSGGWVGPVGLGMLGVAGMIAVIPAMRAIAHPRPGNVQRGVKWGLFALPLFDAILCFAASGGAWLPTVVMLGLALSGILLGRRIRPT